MLKIEFVWRIIKILYKDETKQLHWDELNNLTPLFCRPDMAGILADKTFKQFSSRELFWWTIGTVNVFGLSVFHIVFNIKFLISVFQNFRGVYLNYNFRFWFFNQISIFHFFGFSQFPSLDMRFTSFCSVLKLIFLWALLISYHTKLIKLNFPIFFFC